MLVAPRSPRGLRLGTSSWLSPLGGGLVVPGGVWKPLGSPGCPQTAPGSPEQQGPPATVGVSGWERSKIRCWGGYKPSPGTCVGWRDWDSASSTPPCQALGFSALG